MDPQFGSLLIPHGASWPGLDHMVTQLGMAVPPCLQNVKSNPPVLVAAQMVVDGVVGNCRVPVQEM